MKSAVTLMAKEKGLAFVLAGGTDLLVKMKGGFLEPDLVVDIKRIKASMTSRSRQRIHHWCRCSRCCAR
jgi:carbon-monoxide dehydrogenase medium subunit